MWVRGRGNMFSWCYLSKLLIPPSYHELSGGAMFFICYIFMVHLNPAPGRGVA